MNGINNGHRVSRMDLSWQIIQHLNLFVNYFRLVHMINSRGKETHGNI